MLEETVQDDLMTTEELTLMRDFISLMATRGAVQAEEFLEIGALYERLVELLESFEFEIDEQVENVENVDGE